MLPWDPFAPLELNGAEPHTQPQTDRHGYSITELAQWARFSEKETYLDTSQFLPPPPPHHTSQFLPPPPSPPPKVGIRYINFSYPERSRYIFICLCLLIKVFFCRQKSFFSGGVKEKNIHLVHNDKLIPPFSETFEIKRNSL